MADSRSVNDDPDPVDSEFVILCDWWRGEKVREVKMSFRISKN